ncbi:TPA: LPXTG cell wall anchor domain-containing protein [Enterococcus faecalis]
MKKNVWVFAVTSVFFSLILFPTKNYASESKDIHSNVGVGFYGKYEYPKNFEVESSHTSYDGDISISDDSTNNQLPSTGEQREQWILLAGSFLILVLALLVIKRQKKLKDEEK